MLSLHVSSSCFFGFIVYASCMGLGFDEAHDGCLNLVWAHIIFIKKIGLFYAMEVFIKCLCHLVLLFIKFLLPWFVMKNWRACFKFLDVYYCRIINDHQYIWTSLRMHYLLHNNFHDINVKERKMIMYLYNPFKYLKIVDD